MSNAINKFLIIGRNTLTFHLNSRFMKTTFSKPLKCVYTSMAFILVMIAITLPSCASHNEACEAYQNIELELEAE